MKGTKGVLIDNEGELVVENNSLKIGNSTIQEVSMICMMNQGEWKFEPLLGANLVHYVKTNVSRFDIQNRIKTHLQLDGKDYSDVKNLIKITQLR